MARTFDLRLVATDPQANDVELAYLGARKRAARPTLLGEADFVVACCLLDATTRHLFGDARVRAHAAGRVLHQRRARPGRRRSGADRGAARSAASRAPRSTCSSRSRSIPRNPLLAMDNVIVTPHALCWTDECFHNMASIGLTSIVDALARPACRSIVVERARASSRRTGRAVMARCCARTGRSASYACTCRSRRFAQSRRRAVMASRCSTKERTDDPI